MIQPVLAAQFASGAPVLLYQFEDENGASCSIAATTAPATFSGGATSVPKALIVAVTQAAVFSGGATSIPVSGVLISAATANAVFAGYAYVSPKAGISAHTAAAVFSGGATGHQDDIYISSMLRYSVAAESRRYTIHVEHRNYTISQERQ